MFGARSHHDELERGTTTISRSRNTANIDAARKLHEAGQGLGSFELFSINRSRATRHAVMRFEEVARGGDDLLCNMAFENGTRVAELLLRVCREIVKS